MQQISPIKERILQYIDFVNVSKYKFYQESGITRGVLDKDSGISEDNIAKFIAYAPLVNLEWLLNGEGEMLKTKSEKIVTKENGNKKSNINGNKPNVQKYSAMELVEFGGIPLIPIDAMAGFGTGETAVMDYETSLYVVPEFTEIGVDFMIRVKGSSMYPKYNSGDIVACKKLNITDIFFQWNKVYVLDTDQGAIIKRVKKGLDEEHVLLVSDNVNYDPFELHLSKVYAVAIVASVIRFE